MYQPWLVSHLNGRSDKDSLSGGPGEMLSRSHALTPRDVYRDVIIEPKYFVNALPRTRRRMATLTTGMDENPDDTSWLTRATLSTAEIDSSQCLARSPCDSTDFLSVCAMIDLEKMRHSTADNVSSFIFTERLRVSWRIDKSFSGNGIAKNCYGCYNNIRYSQRKKFVNSSYIDVALYFRKWKPHKKLPAFRCISLYI